MQTLNRAKHVAGSCGMVKSKPDLLLLISFRNHIHNFAAPGEDKEKLSVFCAAPNIHNLRITRFYVMPVVFELTR
jgi:hypothetical protein